MLDIGCNDVFALVFVRHCHAFDSMIDRFGPTGSKNNPPTPTGP
jgi:hypothetical protein